MQDERAGSVLNGAPIPEDGTHTGEFLGRAPTGKRFTVRNVQVMRIVDGKRVERWGSTDELGVLQQLGLIERGRPGAADRRTGAGFRTPSMSDGPAQRAGSRGRFDRALLTGRVPLATEVDAFAEAAARAFFRAHHPS